nr:GNAT family N-acetyltransferase [Paenibacillus phyllosphaerae]
MIAKLDEDLLERYEPADIHGLDFTAPSIGDMIFVVAFEDDIAVGCGAIRPLDHSCVELKRFFVDKAHRRLGIAKQMLETLEREAASRGFRSIRLETGKRQPEAIAFYQKNGYEQIAPFGPYVGEKYSVCFEKWMAVRPA